MSVWSFVWAQNVNSDEAHYKALNAHQDKYVKDDTCKDSLSFPTGSTSGAAWGCETMDVGVIKEAKTVTTPGSPT